MEKKREQELSVLEVLRLHREFHLPHPVPADGQEKSDACFSGKAAG